MCAHKIVIVDDHPLFRDALDQALQTALDAGLHSPGRLIR